MKDTDLKKLIETTTEDLLDKQAEELAALQAKHATEIEIREAVERLKDSKFIIEQSEATNVSPVEWLLDAVSKASDATGFSVGIRESLYYRLSDLAAARGITVDQLTQGSSFTDYVEEASRRGAF